MATTATTTTTERALASAGLIDGAGHFPGIEQPAYVYARILDRLARTA